MCTGSSKQNMRVWNYMLQGVNTHIEKQFQYTHSAH